MRRWTYSTTAPITDINSWSPMITVAQGINRITGNGGFLPNGLRAIVLPTVKYNTATHQAVAIWHDRTAPEPTDQTALYFTTFNPATIGGPVGWWQINDSPLTQMQPAIDNDDAGNMLVSYFSTQTYGTFYQLYGLCLSPAGSVTCGPTALDASGYINRFIGDYHENHYWTLIDSLGARWSTSWSNSTGNFDTQVTGVQ